MILLRILLGLLTLGTLALGNNGLYINGNFNHDYYVCTH